MQEAIAIAERDAHAKKQGSSLAVEEHEFIAGILWKVALLLLFRCESVLSELVVAVCAHRCGDCSRECADCIRRGVASRRE